MTEGSSVEDSEPSSFVLHAEKEKKMCIRDRGVPMKLHAAGEDYLEAILVLQKKQGMVRSVDEMCIRDRNECELAQPDCPSERIEEILRSFDLLDFKDRHPMALSGGQKQRLAVATAILSDKDVLVFDEPTSGLDYHRMLEVSNMIRKLNDENKVIIIVSHDFVFLDRTCDKIFNMEGCSKERR